MSAMLYSPRFIPPAVGAAIAPASLANSDCPIAWPRPFQALSRHTASKNALPAWRRSTTDLDATLQGRIVAEQAVHERRRQAFQRFDSPAGAEAGSVIIRIGADFEMPRVIRVLVERY